MIYPVEYYVPTLAQIEKYKSSGRVSYNESKKKFLAGDKSKVSEKKTLYGGQTETMETPKDQRHPLEPFDHLLLGINIWSHTVHAEKTPLLMATKSSYVEDMKAALQVAIEGDVPMAPYYMAKMLLYFEGEAARAQIDELMGKAAAVQATPEFIELFNTYLPQCKKLQKTDLKSYDAVMKDLMQCYLLGFSIPDLLSKALQLDATKEDAGRYFFHLATRYKEKNDELGALKYALAALSCDNQAAQKFIQDNYPEQKFPDLVSFSGTLKTHAAKLDRVDAKLRLIDSFLAFYELYRYLHQKNDSNAKKLFRSLSFDVVNQDLRQVCLVTLMNRLHSKKISDDDLLSAWINARSEEIGLKATDYSFGLGLFKGSDSFHTKLLKVLEIARMPGMSFDTLVAGNDCLLECLHSQTHIEGSFAKQLIVLSTKPIVESDGRVTDKVDVSQITLGIGKPQKVLVEIEWSSEPLEKDTDEEKVDSTL